MNKSKTHICRRHRSLGPILVANCFLVLALLLQSVIHSASTFQPTLPTNRGKLVREASVANRVRFEGVSAIRFGDCILRLENNTARVFRRHRQEGHCAIYRFVSLGRKRYAQCTSVAISDTSVYTKDQAGTRNNVRLLDFQAASQSLTFAHENDFLLCIGRDCQLRSVRLRQGHSEAPHSGNLFLRRFESTYEFVLLNTERFYMRGSVAPNGSIGITRTMFALPAVDEIESYEDDPDPRATGGLIIECADLTEIVVDNAVVINLIEFSVNWYSSASGQLPLSYIMGVDENGLETVILKTNHTNANGSNANSSYVSSDGDVRMYSGDAMVNRTASFERGRIAFFDVTEYKMSKNIIRIMLSKENRSLELQLPERLRGPLRVSHNDTTKTTKTSTQKPRKRVCLKFCPLYVVNCCK